MTTPTTSGTYRTVMKEVPVKETSRERVYDDDGRLISETTTVRETTEFRETTEWVPDDNYYYYQYPFTHVSSEDIRKLKED